MIRHGMMALAAAALAGCAPEAGSGNNAAVAANGANDGAAQQTARVSLTRLDCGTATIKNFDAFFSDRPGLYEKGPREITDSCYLIRHRGPTGDQVMIWDTGFAAGLKGQSQDMGDLVARMDRTIVEQLADLGIKAEDVDIVGISHMHPDHTGQAAQFVDARLLIGKGDFEGTKGKDDPFGSWRTIAKNLTLVTSDTDIFGDGSVTALHLPGHTPDHLALLVRLPGGPVLLSGDLYHSADARAKRGVPPFNTDRAQTLASMDQFEKLAKETGAKVIIQHEPRDNAKLPGVAKAAE
ncbi:MAG: N-acyl homoserine lactonase family protein [Sphingomonas sp.]|nr:N-acyl homoserine lactonase family protein [Sphingomonas sp.]